MAIVEFKDVSRVYTSGDHELWALNHVDMILEEGKVVVIQGPSGAGKSTLLNMLGGLDSPTGGKIIVNGKDISTLSFRQAAHQSKRLADGAEGRGVTEREMPASPSRVTVCIVPLRHYQLFRSSIFQSSV